MLDLRRLRIFAAVAQGGSFTAAASALFLSQPAVSQQMAILEREAGVPLLERLPRGVRLTAAGTLLAERTARLLVDVASIEAELRDLGRAGQEVRLGAFGTAGADLVPRAIRGYQERHPDVRVVLTPVHVTDVAAGLRAGRIQVGLVWDYDFMPQPGDPALDRVELLADPLRVVVPPDHPAAGRTQVTLRELASEAWIVRDHRPPYAQAFEQMCRVAGFEPRIAFRTDTYQAIQGLVAARIGLGLMPALSLAPCRLDVSIVPMAPPGFTRRIAAVAAPEANRSQAVDDLLDALRATGDELGRAVDG